MLPYFEHPFGHFCRSFQSLAQLKHCSAALFSACSGGAEIETAEKLWIPAALMAINHLLVSPDTILPLMDHRRVMLLLNSGAELIRLSIGDFCNLDLCSISMGCCWSHEVDHVSHILAAINLPKSVRMSHKVVRVISEKISECKH